MRISYLVAKLRLFGITYKSTYFCISFPPFMELETNKMEGCLRLQLHISDHWLETGMLQRRRKSSSRDARRPKRIHQNSRNNKSK